MRNNPSLAGILKRHLGENPALQEHVQNSKQFLRTPPFFCINGRSSTVSHCVWNRGCWTTESRPSLNTRRTHHAADWKDLPLQLCISYCCHEIGYTYTSFQTNAKIVEPLPTVQEGAPQGLSGCFSHSNFFPLFAYKIAEGLALKHESVGANA